jgi:hypothetical protein
MATILVCWRYSSLTLVIVAFNGSALGGGNDDDAGGGRTPGLIAGRRSECSRTRGSFMKRPQRPLTTPGSFARRSAWRTRQCCRLSVGSEPRRRLGSAR